MLDIAARIKNDEKSTKSWRGPYVGELINCIFTQIKINSHNLPFNSPGHRALTVTCQTQLSLEGKILINDFKILIS